MKGEGLAGAPAGLSLGAGRAAPARAYGSQRHNVGRVPELDFFARKLAAGKKGGDGAHWHRPYGMAGQAAALPDAHASLTAMQAPTSTASHGSPSHPPHIAQALRHGLDNRSVPPHCAASPSLPTRASSCTPGAPRASCKGGPYDCAQVGCTTVTPPVGRLGLHKSTAPILQPAPPTP